MEQEQHRGFKASWFFKWFINNTSSCSFSNRPSLIAEYSLTQ